MQHQDTAPQCSAAWASAPHFHLSPIYVDSINMFCLACRSSASRLLGKQGRLMWRSRPQVVYNCEATSLQSASGSKTKEPGFGLSELKHLFSDTQPEQTMLCYLRYSPLLGRPRSSCQLDVTYGLTALSYSLHTGLFLKKPGHVHNTWQLNLK